MKKEETIEPTGAVTLRKLARKSVMWFGKYKDRSIQQLLDMKNYRAIRWYYYNIVGVSFIDDILEEVGITEEWRIEKPGKDPDKNEQLNEEFDKRSRLYSKDMYEAGNMVMATQRKRSMAEQAKGRRREYRSFKRRDAATFSKGNMAWINQGH